MHLVESLLRRHRDPMAFFGANHEVHVTKRNNRTGSWLRFDDAKDQGGLFPARHLPSEALSITNRYLTSLRSMRS
jgi:hypothetical protein